MDMHCYHGCYLPPTAHNSYRHAGLGVEMPQFHAQLVMQTHVEAAAAHWGQDAAAAVLPLAAAVVPTVHPSSAAVLALGSVLLLAVSHGAAYLVTVWQWR